MVLGYLVFGEIDGMVECLGSTTCCFVPLFCSSCLFCFGQFEEGFGFCIGWLLCFVQLYLFIYWLFSSHSIP
jgi:hypothetical protein